ncbi:hypothetical protein [Streptomonospora litoralis]|nr:hypothetical protein [Streptomonospora litoralis]
MIGVADGCIELDGKPSTADGVVGRCRRNRRWRPHVVGSMPGLMIALSTGVLLMCALFVFTPRRALARYVSARFEDPEAVPTSRDWVIIRICFAALGLSIVYLMATF